MLLCLLDWYHVDICQKYSVTCITTWIANNGWPRIYPSTSSNSFTSELINHNCHVLWEGTCIWQLNISYMHFVLLSPCSQSFHMISLNINTFSTFKLRQISHREMFWNFEKFICLLSVRLVIAGRRWNGPLLCNLVSALFNHRKLFFAWLRAKSGKIYM